MKNTSFLLVVVALAASAMPTYAAFGRDNGDIVDLNEDNWRMVLKGEWMILL